MHKFGEFEKFGEKIVRNEGLEQYLFKFPNGYGASVINGKGVYGSKEYPYDLALIKRYGDKWNLCYSKEITVIGYLDERGVIELLRKIQELEGIENGNIQYQ